MVYRDLAALPDAEGDFSEFLEGLFTALTDGRRDPNDVVQETLFQIYFGADLLRNQRSPRPDCMALPPATRAVVHSVYPRNVTTEPEYYSDIDASAYLERKPFIWLWQMFDRSPLGQNALLGHRFRRMLPPL